MFFPLSRGIRGGQMRFFYLILVVAVIVTIYCINLQYELFAFNIPKEQEKRENCLRVMTYNVNTTSSLKDVDGFKMGLIEEIEQHNPDILCLQELVPAVFKQIQSSMDSLFGYVDSMKISKEPLRYTIYSKYPIRYFKRYKCTTEIDTLGFDQITNKEVGQIQRKMPVYSAEIEIGPEKWITLFSVHLRSSAYSTARRSMDEDESWKDGLPLYYKNYKIGQKIRNWEVNNLRPYLDSLEAEDAPIIIAGDFNDWSGSYCMNAIRKGIYKDAWWEGGFGFGITYDGWHLKLRLDHILYSHHFRLENVYVVKSKFSDHRPLVADFTMLP